MENHAADLLSGLNALAHFRCVDMSLNDSLQRLSRTIAEDVDVENCSIMLSDDGSSLKVRASSGSLPDAAYRESVKKGEGISGRVLSTGLPLMIDDIGKSEFASHARKPRSAKKGAICVPIAIDGSVLGVLNVNNPNRREKFVEEDLHAMGVAGAFVGRIIQTQQLQSALVSRFAQMSLVDGEKMRIRVDDAQNPEKMAKILARSFYREMAGAGFSPAQIIDAASEIISELGKSVRRFSGRVRRG